MTSERRNQMQARFEALTAERWNRINELLDAALAQPTEERRVYLAQHCGGDTALQDQVLALLDAFEEAKSFLEQPDAYAAPLLPNPTATSLEGQRIGPYRLLRHLAEGGMGAVYLAARDDQQYQKRVAAKLIRPGMATEEVRRRFLSERQILARLEHPHIARLLDGGMTDDHRPYFILEYVDGEPLDAYCDKRRLSISTRLRLFLDTCKAVQYAHQNLVVHRDLKPSNILVTRDGTVKLLDFGIAKILLEEGTSDEALLQTKTGRRVMTPAFAAPEQLSGAPISTATDVYALGVLLHVLLTGHHPFRIHGVAPHALEHAILETMPAKPSTLASRRDGGSLTEDTGLPQTPTAIAERRGTNAVGLRRQLSGDLDTIILKALNKEPARRYASAEAFSDDIERYLQGLPVRARKDTFRYRAAKFIRRHRLSVVAALLALLSLTAGLIGTTWQARIADAERARAEEVAAILPELFWSLEPGELQSATVTPLELLNRGTEKIEARLGNQPDLQAQVLTLVSDVYMRLGAHQEAETLARKALGLRQQLFGETHAEVAASMAMLAQALDKQGKFEEAEPLHQKALSMRRAHLGNTHLDVATSLHNYAMFLTTQARYEEAENHYLEALSIRRQAYPADHRDLGFTQTNLGVVRYYQGAYDEAEQRVRDALAMRQRLFGEEHPDVAHSLHTLASILQAKGDREEALLRFQEVLVLHKKTLGENHPVVAITLNSLAVLSRELGHYDEAETYMRQGMTINKQTLGDEHPTIANDLHNLAFILEAKEQPEEAEALYREALALKEKAIGPEHPDVAYTLIGLGSLLMRRSVLREASALLRRAVTIRQQALPDDHHLTADAQSRLGEALGLQAQDAEAEPLLEGGFTRLREHLGLDHDLTQAAARRLSDYYEARHVPDKASSYRALLDPN